MAPSPEDLHVDQLADHPELFGQVGILRWKEWAYGEKDPARFIEVTAREGHQQGRQAARLCPAD
jgi:hypothetical protein